MKLSIAMMVKNEERYLRQCLESLKPILERVETELIIVDTGSTDQTVEIAKLFTGHVYTALWENDFAKMRNTTIAYATGDWILIIDGDEIISRPEGLIAFLTSSESKRYNSGLLKIINIKDESDISKNPVTSAMRLFRNAPDFRYAGRIHEQPLYREPTLLVETDIIHYGYLETDPILMAQKYDRNVLLLKEELVQDSRNAYLWHQLSQSYGMNNNRKEALVAAQKAYDLARGQKLDLSRRMYIYTHLALTYLWEGDITELEAICLEGIRVKDGYPDLYFYLGKAQKHRKRPQEAIKAYTRYVALIEGYDTGVAAKDSSTATLTLGLVEEAICDLVELHTELKHFEEALTYGKMLRTEPFISRCRPHIIRSCFKMKTYEQLKRIYCKQCSDSRGDLAAGFWLSLEHEIKETAPEEALTIYSIFSSGVGAYALLNQARLRIHANNYELDPEWTQSVLALNPGGLPVIFGDLVYYLLRLCLLSDQELRVSVLDWLISFNQPALKAGLWEVCFKCNDLRVYAVPILDSFEFQNRFRYSKVRNHLAKAMMLATPFEEPGFRRLWEIYLETGFCCILQEYGADAISEEKAGLFKSAEETALGYLLLAHRHETVGSPGYYRCLRKALAADPEIRTGIELLSARQENIDRKPIGDGELEAFRRQLKANIELLVNRGAFNDAERMLGEYEQIQPDDEDINGFRAVMAMLAQKYPLAREELAKGLKKNPQSKDLNFNLAYVFEQSGHLVQAYLQYQGILKLSGGENDLDVAEKLKFLSEIPDVRAYIRSI